MKQRTTMQVLDKARRQGLMPPSYVMLALCPVDERLMPECVLIAPWQNDQDCRWLINLPVVLGHDGDSIDATIRIAEKCNAFGALSVECLNVMRQEWVSVFFDGKPYIKADIPAW